MPITIFDRCDEQEFLNAVRLNGLLKFNMDTTHCEAVACIDCESLIILFSFYCLLILVPPITLPGAPVPVLGR